MAQSRLQFVTLSGVPIEVSELKWPFHPSTSGSDWLVLHGRVDLLGSSEGLHAEVAVGMTQTMKESLGSLAQEHAEGLVVNAIRKTIDNGQLAFLKSGKLQPAHVTSRFYSFVTQKIQFPTQNETDVKELIRRRVFWLNKIHDGQQIDVASRYDCEYVNFTQDKMLELARQLAAEGWIRIEGAVATATNKLMQQEPAMVAAMQKAVEAGKAATKVTA
ncbi:MAG TPA: hypothetical protein VE783_06780 [Candidatus Limnocylindrales bacterium]|nr:hypothetical protein [Candidatus Limnocylindrales bacterium]